MNSSGDVFRRAATVALSIVLLGSERAPTDPWPVPGPDMAGRIVGVSKYDADLFIPHFYANGAEKFVFPRNISKAKWQIASIKFRSDTDTFIILGPWNADGSMATAQSGAHGQNIGGQPSYGDRGRDGGRGGDGAPGSDAVDFDLSIGNIVMPQAGHRAQLRILAQGGTGGGGGDGGSGQLGGGSQCGNPGFVTRYDGGDGGNGGNGGNGGPGGRAARIYITVSIDGVNFHTLDLTRGATQDAASMTLSSDGSSAIVEIIVSGLRGGLGGQGGDPGRPGHGGDEGWRRDCGPLLQDAYGGHSGKPGTRGTAGPDGGPKS